MRKPDAHDDIDDLLGSEPRIEPERDFGASVMRSVRREAAAPPIAFPWRRAAIGLGISAAAAVAAVVMLAQAPEASYGVLGELAAFDPSQWGWRDVPRLLADPTIRAALSVCSTAVLVGVVLRRFVRIRFR